MGLLPSLQTNMDDNVLAEHMREDAAFQKEMREWRKTVATRNDMREIFAEELKTFFKVSGINVKTFIIGAAVIVGALTVIFGGVKAILGWFGFTLMK